MEDAMTTEQAERLCPLSMWQVSTWLCLLVVLCGCRQLQKSASLPAAHLTASGPLVLHTDFRLAKRDPILAELSAQRDAISNLLDVPAVEQPVHVYLFASREKFQSFMNRRFPEFPDRRAFYVESDGHRVVYAHWNQRVAEDLRHEVAHGYLHAAIPALPLWLDEGLAEYFEVPLAHRGMNMPHVHEIVSALQQESWSPDLRRLESITSVSDLSQRDYAEAWAWVHYLLETDDAHRRILRSYVGQLRSSGAAMPLSEAMRPTDGADPAGSLVNHLTQLHSRSLQR